MDGNELSGIQFAPDGQPGGRVTQKRAVRPVVIEREAALVRAVAVAVEAIGFQKRFDLFGEIKGPGADPSRMRQSGNATSGQ